MSLSVVGTSLPQYQVPNSPQAAIDDAVAKSTAVKQNDDATNKYAPAPIQKSTHVLDVKA